MPLRSFSASEMLLTERARLEKPLLVMILLGVISLSLATGSWFYLVVGTFAVAINLAAVWRSREIYVSRLFVNIAVIGATGLMLLELLTRRTEVLIAVSHYLILIQVCKLFERKTNRDYVQMLTMSFLTVVATTLISEQMWFGVLLVAYLAIGSYTVMVFMLKRGLDAACASRLPIEAAPPAPDQVAWNTARDWPEHSLRWRVSYAMFVMLATGALMFLLMPRTGNIADTLAQTMLQRPAVTGMGQEVRLGDVNEVYQSDRVIMYMDMSTQDISKLGHRVYLRGQVLTRYANSRWSRTRQGGVRMRNVEHPPLPEALGGQAVSQDISILPVLLPTLFGLHPAVQVESDDVGIRNNELLEARVVTHTAQDRPVKYHVKSWAGKLTPQQVQYLAAIRAYDVGELDSPHERVQMSVEAAELAYRWCSDLIQQRHLNPHRSDELDLAIADRIASQLRSLYRYSLDLTGSDPSRDGVDDFLFHTRRGHCEYFASAMTAMCCSLGIEARMATGFVAQEYDNVNKQYVIRERDAHAWTEVFTPGTDWVLFDATPASGDDSSSAGWWTFLKRYWERAQFQWYDKVIAYNSSTRTLLGRGVVYWLNSLWQGAKAWAANLRQAFILLLMEGTVDATIVRLAIAIAAVALSVEAVLVGRMIRRRWRLRRGAMCQETACTIARFVPRMLAMFERRGLRRRPGQTLRQLADQAAAELALPQELLDELVSLYYELRWGHATISAQRLKQAYRQVVALERKSLAV